MTAAGLKLRLCPFCGCEDVYVRCDSPDKAYVRCPQCLTDGPYVTADDAGPGYDSMDASDQRKIIKAIAADRWNMRPAHTDMTPEEFIRMVAEGGKADERGI